MMQESYLDPDAYLEMNSQLKGTHEELLQQMLSQSAQMDA